MASSNKPSRNFYQIEPPRKETSLLQTKQTMRVAAYCRVSTGSEGQRTSYTTQKKVYTQMISSHPEWTFAGIYADEGITGTRVDKRPQFKKMIEDCLAGEIDYIITKSISRFARNTVDCLEYVRLLRKRGIGIYFEEQNINTLSADSELLIVIYAGFAQAESEAISKNVTWSYRKRFSQGNVCVPFTRILGYRRGKDGEPEIVPEEAALVIRIYSMFLNGETTHTISETFRREGICIPSKGITFSSPMLLKVLRNEKYCGDVILQKTVTVDCIAHVRRQNMGEAPMYYVENNHPAIISRELYRMVQREIERRNNLESVVPNQHPKGKYSRYSLTGKLICGECGWKYRRVTWTANGKQIVWRCSNRLENGKRYCKTAPTLLESQLHAAIARACQRLANEDQAQYSELVKVTVGRIIDLVVESQSASTGRKSFPHALEDKSDCALCPITSMSTPESIVESPPVVFDDLIVRHLIEEILVYSNGSLKVLFKSGHCIIVRINPME